MQHTTAQHSTEFDLNLDSNIDNEDLSEWLCIAAIHTIGSKFKCGDLIIYSNDTSHSTDRIVTHIFFDSNVLQWTPSLPHSTW